MLFPSSIFADQTTPDPGSKLTCDQVWKIVGSENCERFVVSNDEGGVWCNLPDTRESLQPWIYGPAPAYTFAPGTCQVESGDQQTVQPDEGQKNEQSAQAADTQRVQPRGWIPLFATGWLDYFRNLWTIVSFKFTGNPFIQFVNGFSGTDHTLCDPSTCDQAMEAIRRGTDLTEEDVIFRSQQSRTLQNYKLQKQNGNVNIGEYNNSRGLNIKTGQDGKVFSTFSSSENDMGGVRVFPNTQINLPPQPFQFPGRNLDSTSNQVPTSVELESGEAEFFIIGSAEKPTTRLTFTVATPNAQVTVSGTHFWVSYNKKESISTVGVYEGKVDVKTKDGKTTTVSPNGDPSTGSGQSKPGVVIISQKLSVVRLAIVGGVLAVIIGGIIFFLKKRGKGFLTPKKKTSR